jgi:NADPH:quinone reductase-like Zn-dependent oxidoreductase
MKAAILKAWGSPLAIETLPDPILGTGEIIVDVVATRVLSYANEVFSGERKYLLELPVVPGPGAIARVRGVGPDATHLAAGDWVYCDPTVRSRDDALNPDITLQGWSARGEGGLRLQKHFRHGSWAEQMLVPTENVKPIGPIAEADAVQWCALGTLLVPYGGFLAAKLQAGETVLVSGATGNFGSAAVAVALAMGAACVIAPGRNEKVLEDLARRFGDRLRPVKLSGTRTTIPSGCGERHRARSTACWISCHHRPARQRCAPPP